MKIVVSTVAFSKNIKLAETLRSFFPDAIINDKGQRIGYAESYNYFKDAEGIIVGLERIDDDLLEKLPNLRIISKFGVGLDNIDVDACQKRGIKIGWTGGVNKYSVAEMTIGFMIMLSRNLYVTSNQLKNGVWNKNGGRQLSQKVIGIIGLGNIGKEVVRLLKPFGCKIIANDIEDRTNFANRNYISLADKDEIYQNADIVTIHTPLTDITNKLINKAVFEKMKRTTFIINTARGEIVDYNALKWALINNRIAGAAIDVYDSEPPKDKKLISFPNLICTPHIGGNAEEAVLAMGNSAIQHLVNYKNQRL